MWPKLTAYWLVSLSTVTCSMATVFCDASWPVDIWRRNSHHCGWKHWRFWGWCISGCCGTHLIPVVRTETKEGMCITENRSAKIWARMARCFRIKNGSGRRHLCQVIHHQVGEAIIRTNQHTRELISARKTSHTKTWVAYGNSHLACV